MTESASTGTGAALTPDVEVTGFAPRQALRTGIVAAIVTVALAFGPNLGLTSFYLHLLILILIFMIATIGFNLVFQVGEVTLAQGAFMAIGAYMSGMLSYHGFNVWLSMVAGVLAAAAVAWLLGRIILRAGGEFYFLLITFAFAEIVRLALLNWVGGPDGVPGIPNPTVFGFGLGPRAWYFRFVLVVAVLAFLLARWIIRSETGRTITMVREGRNDLAPAVGIDTMHHRLIVFTVGSAFGGLAGVLYAHYLNFMAPNLFNVGLTILIVTMAVVGGMGSTWGPLIGAGVIVILRESLRGHPELHVLIYGLALIVMMLFMRDGLAGATRRVVARLRTSPGGA